jgi:hypothetical protein
MNRFATLPFLAPVLIFAGTWLGVLVDSNCYTSELRNTNKDPRVSGLGQPHA